MNTRSQNLEIPWLDNMYAVGKISDYISSVASPFQPFGGAVDIIVVQQPDGTFKSTPWYVRFGKFQGILKRSEAIVTVMVNGVKTDFPLYLDNTGAAYFLKEVESDEEESASLHGSSHSSEDEALVGSRRESFKSAHSQEGIDLLVEKSTGRDGVDKTEAGNIRVSLNIHSLDSISQVSQSNGDVLISFSEHSLRSSHKKIGNELVNSNSKPSPTGEDNDAESKLHMASDNRVDSSFSLPENAGNQQNSSLISPFVGELANGSGIQNSCNHLESSVMKPISSTVATLDSTTQTEYQGGGSHNGWDSYGGASVFSVEGSSGTYDVSAGSTSQADAFLLSSFSAYDYENMNLPPLEDISDSRKIGNSSSEVILMSVDGHVMTAPISSLKRVESGDLCEPQLSIVSGQDSCKESGEKIKPVGQVVNGSTEYDTDNHDREPKEISSQYKADQNTRMTHFSDNLVKITDNNTPERNMQSQYEISISKCIPDSERDSKGNRHFTDTAREITIQGHRENDALDSNESFLQTVNVMTEPISSLSCVDTGNMCEPQLNVVSVQNSCKESIEKIESVGQVMNGPIVYEIGKEQKEISSQRKTDQITGLIHSSDDLVNITANNTPERNMRSQFEISISGCIPQSERDCKGNRQFIDMSREITIQGHGDNDAKESNECCLQTDVNAREMPRTESELEFAFNDEEIFKSCLALSELSPSTGEEEKHSDLYPHLEEEEKEHDLVESEKNSTGSLPDITHDSRLQHVRDSTSSLGSDRSSAIHVPAPNIEGRKQSPGSLPNMGFHFRETSASKGLLSRSLEINSSFCERSMNQDRPLPTPENMEPGVKKKNVVQEEETSELCNLDGRETSNGTVQHDTGIEISLCRPLLIKGMGTEAAAEAFDSKRVSKEEFSSSGVAIIKNEKLVVRIRGRYFPWSAAAPVVLGMAAFGLETPAEPEGEILVEDIETKAQKNYTSDSNVPSGGGWSRRLWPFSFRRPRTPENSSPVRSLSNPEVIIDQDAAFQSPSDKALELKNCYSSSPKKRKVRTNLPTSEQLASLNLKEGQNMITFTFLTSLWGKQQVDARIYLWKWNTRIVISDVDGTITKSDVLGQVMPLVGRDWTQTGVARFFSAIKENGYQLLFLSARAIAQAYLTRQFLLNLKQDGKALPDGPVLISPDGLFPSLYREVIRRAPHEFKISCLEDIRALFPPDCQPFYAGFGNRDTDEISYLKVGIPKGKIFIINPKGEVVVNHRVDVKSYTSLHKLADDIFPPVASSEQEDFNSWNYWKVALPNIED